MQHVEKERSIVETEISIHPDMEGSVSEFQKECYKDEIEKLPPIKEGDVNVSTDFIFDIGDKYEASIFIRNGLNKPINFEIVPFIVVNGKGEVVGRKAFDLRELGDIPPKSVRPWKIYFNKDDINPGENSLQDLRIVFDTRIKAERTVKLEFENLPDKIQGIHRKKYEKFLESLPLLRVGQVSFSAYEVHKNKDGGVSITIVIRNGSNRAINIEKVPISLIDANEDVVASGVFYLDNVIVNPMKARLYNFTFNSHEIMKEDMDLSSWTVKFTTLNIPSIGDEKRHEE